jgi:LPXTG-site transpeptidase (sortase) family protein
MTRIATAVITAAVAAIVAAAVWLTFTGGTPPADAGRPLPVATSVPPLATDNPFRPKEAVTGAPTRVRVPAIGVDSPLESLRIGAGGELDAPVDYALAGWYADGTAPGDVGPAVIAGHVDSVRGPAVFARLKELKAGDTVEVARGGTTVAFTVTGSSWHPKARFPTAEVYGPTPDRQLRLITCGGSFDRGQRTYRDNLVVYAVAG